MISPHGIGVTVGDLRQLEAIGYFVVTVFLVWFANTWLTGLLAERRGREGGLWTVLGIFLGPIALIALLLLPRLPRRNTDRGGSPELRDAVGTLDWPVLNAPAPITTQERVLTGVLGALIGAVGAGIIVGIGGVEAAAFRVLIGAAAAAVVGSRLADALLDTDRNGVIGRGLLAGLLVLFASSLMTAVVSSIGIVLTSDVGIDLLVAYAAALFGALVYPFSLPITAPGVLLVALVAGVLWAAITRLALRQVRSSRSMVRSPSEG